MERITLYGSFTSSSSYKPMLYLALARLPFSFRTVNLKYGRQKEPEYLAINRWGVVPSLRHRGLTILQSNVILDYLARETGHFEGATEQERWEAREWLSWEADQVTGSPGCGVQHFGPRMPKSSRVSAESRGGIVLYRHDRRTATGRRQSLHDRRYRLPGAAWCSWPKAASCHWPLTEAWSRRLKAMPGFRSLRSVPSKRAVDSIGMGVPSSCRSARQGRPGRRLRDPGAP